MHPNAFLSYISTWEIERTWEKREVQSAWGTEECFSHFLSVLKNWQVLLKLNNARGIISVRSYKNYDLELFTAGLALYSDSFLSVFDGSDVNIKLNTFDNVFCQVLEVQAPVNIPCPFYDPHFSVEIFVECYAYTIVLTVSNYFVQAYSGTVVQHSRYETFRA